MKTLPSALAVAKNTFNQNSPWLILTKLTLPDATVYRLVNNTEDLVFQGNTYTAFPIDYELPSESSKGEIPSLNVKISNVTRTIQVKLEELNGGAGSTVELIVVNAGLLSENYAELTMTFNVLSSSYNAQWITFKCGASNPLRRRLLDKYFASHCNWQFKGVECAYAGADTVCDRTLTACRAKNNTLRFGGYPGLEAGGLRLA